MGRRGSDLTVDQHKLVNTDAPYGWRECPTCKGTGINPVVTMYVCPRCNGERRVRLGPFISGER